MLESAAYASLDLTARAVLTELVTLFNGDNNGSLYLSVDDARGRLGIATKHPVLRAFNQLEAVGLIELTKDAHFAVKAAESSRARCWRLAWHPWPECPNKARRIPQYGWEQFEASGKCADLRLKTLAKYRKEIVRGKFPGVDFAPSEAKQGQSTVVAGVNIAPAKAANDRNLPSPVGVNIAPYIDATSGSWWDGEAVLLSRGPYAQPVRQLG
ncbi:MAG: hypothetical protein WBL74_07025 [Novosphingobium sp.]|uniref:hypothetical protein n=1 Tax=Novosphingobium sp. TaxID=1874826 RepID=UPI003C7D1257